MAAQRKTAQPVEKVVSSETIAHAIAKAVLEGDIVNFRLLFLPFSPARTSSTERFDVPKYRYLLPSREMAASAEFQRALHKVTEAETWRHIENELRALRPAQLPWQLLLELGDNAVRHGKYTSAAQAYESLRVRGRMQEEFLRQADDALDAGDIPRAAHGYLVATGLAYNYAAFPEPLPAVPDFQTRALMIHGEYPITPDQCFAAQDTEPFVRGGLAYLLADNAIAARLDKRPIEVRIAMLQEINRRRDPDWDVFARRYREACAMATALGKRLEQASRSRPITLEEEIAAQLGEDPKQIPAHLLGRVIENGAWWQYLKELAYEHPAGVLFLARQVVGSDEILIPRFRAESSALKALGLAPESSAGPGVDA